jgi:hypothetical protein
LGGRRSRDSLVAEAVNAIGRAQCRRRNIEAAVRGALAELAEVI